MQKPRVFVTGVTGYVGGDAMAVISEAHSDWTYSFLVRDRGRVASFVNRCPSARIVVGDLSDTDLIRREALSADIIMTFASSDDHASAQAIRDAMRSDRRTRFWIHTSGTANLMHSDRSNGIQAGDLNPKVWDDMCDIESINTWPETVLHRPVEKLVLGSGADHPNVKVAVIVPPVILGIGRGPGNKRSIQIPILIELIRQRGRAFQVGQGDARWGYVHIKDLSQLYLRAAEEAASGGGAATWGRNGYYFAENGEMSWGYVGRQIAQRLFDLGVLPNNKVDTIGLGEAKRLTGSLGPDSVSSNARNRASRARKLLEWSPRISDFDASLDEQVDFELKSAQSRLDDFRQGHMPKFPAFKFRL